MNVPEEHQAQVYCPQCRQHVTPLQGKWHWYCPQCVWQFTASDLTSLFPPTEPSESEPTEKG